jgi:hypothetical protein
MFEARQGGYEFVTTPCLWFSRGESRRNVGTKLLGAFSLVRFFGACKEMNKKWLKPFDFGLCRNGEKETILQIRPGLRAGQAVPGGP